MEIACHGWQDEDQYEEIEGIERPSEEAREKGVDDRR